MKDGCGLYCAGCTKTKLKDDEYLCPQCRADLDLGRLVRAMPNRSELQRLRKNDWRFFSDKIKRCEAKKTPEEALKEEKK